MTILSLHNNLKELNRFPSHEFNNDINDLKERIDISLKKLKIILDLDKYRVSALYTPLGIKLVIVLNDNNDYIISFLSCQDLDTMDKVLAMSASIGQDIKVKRTGRLN